MKAGGQRIKGSRFERKLVELHLDHGVPAKRIPLSGAQEGWEGDIEIAGIMKGEAKARKGGSGFKVLEKWLADNDVLFLKRDRQEPFVALTFNSYIRLVKTFIMHAESSAAESTK